MTRSLPDTLYHYTCEHGARLIDQTGELRPNPVPGCMPVVWLTDMAYPQREALGLTSYLLQCDRSAHRYMVASCDQIVPWWQWRRGHPEYHSMARHLEAAQGARPMHWYVAERPLPLALPGAPTGVRSGGCSVRP